MFSHFARERSLGACQDGEAFDLPVPRGSGRVIVYPVLPGVEVALMEIQGYRYQPKVEGLFEGLELNYCCQGRGECVLRNGMLQYAGNGDLVIAPIRNHSHLIQFPLGYYQGVVLELDFVPLQEMLTRHGLGERLDLHEIEKKLIPEGRQLHLARQEKTDRLLKDFWTMPPENRRYIYPLRVLELLLILSDMRETMGIYESYEPELVSIVKQIQRCIVERLQENIPAERLAKEYGISLTSLRTGFKGVFGMPMATYLRRYRMEQAARRLVGTEDPVGEISRSLGYQSQGSFGDAFQKIYGLSPRAFRRQARGETSE